MIPLISHLMSCHIPIPNWNDYPDVIDKLLSEPEDVDQFNEIKITRTENSDRQNNLNRHERRKQRAYERAKQKKHRK